MLRAYPCFCGRIKQLKLLVHPHSPDRSRRLFYCSVTLGQYVAPSHLHTCPVVQREDSTVYKFWQSTIHRYQVVLVELKRWVVSLMELSKLWAADPDALKTSTRHWLLKVWTVLITLLTTGAWKWSGLIIFLHFCFKWGIHFDSLWWGFMTCLKAFIFSVFGFFKFSPKIGHFALTPFQNGPFWKFSHFSIKDVF